MIESDLPNQVVSEIEVIQYSNTDKFGDNPSTVTSSKKDPTIETPCLKGVTLINQEKIKWKTNMEKTYTIEV